MATHWAKMIDLLKGRPHAVGAEVGVFRGVFAAKLLAALPGIKTYYAIDPWEMYDDHYKTLQRNSCERTVNQNNAYKQFLNRVKPWQNKIVVLRKMSMDALIDVPDESLDWVFVDANHSYEYSKADILGWSPKVKPGGLISGHDIIDKGKAKGVVRKIPFGVDRAVKEIFPHFQMDANANVWWVFRNK